MDNLSEGFKDVIDEIKVYLGELSDESQDTADDIEGDFVDIYGTLDDIWDMLCSSQSSPSTPTPPPPPPPSQNPPPTPSPPPDLSLASGYEGWIASPTRLLVGEAGPEYLSVMPKSKVGRSGASSIGNVSLNLPNVTSLEDPAQVRMIFRRIMLELSGER